MQDIITINNYAEFERKFDNVMQETAEKFVVIGYMLKVTRDTEILRESGYSSMGEFAQKRYGLTKDIASRYIAINDRYSEGGYSEQLDPKYKAFGYAKLAEMLTLPDTIVEEISPDMTREDIRGIKGEVAAEKEISDIEVLLEEKDQGAEVVDTLLGKVIYQICHEHSDIFKKLWVAVNEESAGIEYLADVLAPSGIAMLSCRIPGTGRLMLSVKGIDENLQIINLRSNEKEEITWKELQQVAVRFLRSCEQDWKVTYWSIYGEEIPEEKPEVAPAQPKSERVVKHVKPEKPKGTPKKKTEEVKPVAVEEQLPGQMEVADYPELMPDNVKGECNDKNKPERDTRSDTGVSGTDVSRTGTENERETESNGTKGTAGEHGKVCENAGRDPETISGSGEQGERDSENSGATGDEQETTQNNGERSTEKSREESAKTVTDRLREVAELERVAAAESEAIRRQFAMFSRGRMPIIELEAAKERAEKVLETINKIISIKKGQ